MKNLNKDELSLILRVASKRIPFLTERIKELKSDYKLPFVLIEKSDEKEEEEQKLKIEVMEQNLEIYKSIKNKLS